MQVISLIVVGCRPQRRHWALCHSQSALVRSLSPHSQPAP